MSTLKSASAVSACASGTCPQTRRPSTTFRVLSDRLGEPRRKSVTLRFREIQDVLGAPDQDVVSGGRPFLRDQETCLALIKRAAEMAPEVSERQGAVQQVFGAGSIPPAIIRCDLCR